MVKHLLQWERGLQTEMEEHESTALRRKQAPLGKPYPQIWSCKAGRTSIWHPDPFFWHHRSYQRWREISTYVSCHTNKGSVYIQCPHAREKFDFFFFLIQKRLFALIDSHQQKYHITEDSSLKYPWWGGSITKSQGRKMPLPRRQAALGTGKPCRSGILQASTWIQVSGDRLSCLHVAARKDRFPWPNCFGLKLFDSLWPSSLPKLKCHIQPYLAFELGRKWLFCSARSLFYLMSCEEEQTAYNNDILWCG